MKKRRKKRGREQKRRKKKREGKEGKKSRLACPEASPSISPGFAFFCLRACEKHVLNPPGRKKAQILCFSSSSFLPVLPNTLSLFKDREAINPSHKKEKEIGLQKKERKKNTHTHIIRHSHRLPPSLKKDSDIFCYSNTIYLSITPDILSLPLLLYPYTHIHTTLRQELSIYLSFFLSFGAFLSPIQIFFSSSLENSSCLLRGAVSHRGPPHPSGVSLFSSLLLPHEQQQGCLQYPSSVPVENPPSSTSTT